MAEQVQAIDAEMAKRLEEIKALEAEGRRRKLVGGLGLMVTAIAVSFALFHLYRGYAGSLGALQQRGIHLSFALALTFLLHPLARRVGRRGPLFALDLCLAAIGALIGAYVTQQYLELTYRMGTPTTLDIALGVAAVLLVLEATRRLIGPPMVILAIFFLLYASFGQYFPGMLAHGGYDFQRIVSHLYLTTEGIFGIPLGVSATFVIMFIIMGAFLQVSGAGEFFFQFAHGLLGRFRGGPAKMSVVASGLFGTISGSAVANVVVDGWLTIPMMQRIGFRPHAAAAVEAVASTGGQLMPPVMGAAAFIIAEILGISYWDVVVAAVVPGILYYTALFVMVDLEAAKMGLKGLPPEELPNPLRVLVGGFHLLIPLFVLVYMLAVLEWSPMKSAFYAGRLTPIFASLPLLRKVPVVRALRLFDIMQWTVMGPRKIIQALESGALGALEVALACACAGIIVGVFTLTGLGMKLSTMLIDLSGGNLFLLLILTAIASLILGMGMPTTACYIVLAVLVAPALIKMGVVPIAAHLFIFYFGIISVITPPVALAAYAAAGIIGTDPFKTGFYATKLGTNGFIIPFMFVYGPAMVAVGTMQESLMAFASGFIGSAALAVAIQGWLFMRMPVWQRVIIGVGAPFLINPGLATDLVGLGLVGLGVVAHSITSRAERRRLAAAAARSNPGQTG